MELVYLPTNEEHNHFKTDCDRLYKTWELGSLATLVVGTPAYEVGHRLKSREVLNNLVEGFRLLSFGTMLESLVK